MVANLPPREIWFHMMDLTMARKEFWINIRKLRLVCRALREIMDSHPEWVIMVPLLDVPDYQRIFNRLQSPTHVEVKLRDMRLYFSGPDEITKVISSLKDTVVLKIRTDCDLSVCHIEPFWAMFFSNITFPSAYGNEHYDGSIVTSTAGQLASLFCENSLDPTDLPYLTHDLLISMGISKAKIRLLIMEERDNLLRKPAADVRNGNRQTYMTAKDILRLISQAIVKSPMMNGVENKSLNVVDPKIIQMDFNRDPLSFDTIYEDFAKTIYNGITPSMDGQNGVLLLWTSKDVSRSDMFKFSSTVNSPRITKRNQAYTDFANKFPNAVCTLTMYMMKDSPFCIGSEGIEVTPRNQENITELERMSDIEKFITREIRSDNHSVKRIIAEELNLIPGSMERTLMHAVNRRNETLVKWLVSQGARLDGWVKDGSNVMSMVRWIMKINRHEDHIFTETERSIISILDEHMGCFDTQPDPPCFICEDVSSSISSYESSTSSSSEDDEIDLMYDHITKIGVNETSQTDEREQEIPLSTTTNKKRGNECNPDDDTPDLKRQKL